jgi:hypothetical protein
MSIFSYYKCNITIQFTGGRCFSISEKKKQHFVPKFYLKHFSNNHDEKTIGIYVIASEKIILSGSLRNQAYKNFFYGEDGQVEEALVAIEAASAKIVQNILISKKAPVHGSTEYLELLVFVSSQLFRTDYVAETLSEATDKFFKALAKHDSTINEDLSDIRFGYVNPASVSLTMAARCFPILIDLQCKILINETERLFLTSDNPVVRYNQFLEHRIPFGSNVGLAAKGLQIFFPLDPWHCLLLYDSDAYRVGRRKKQTISVKLLEDVDSLNVLQFINGNAVLYFQNQTDPSYILELATAARQYRRLNKTKLDEWMSNGTDTGTTKFLMYMYPEDVRTHMKLSFISETKKAKRYRIGNKVIHLRNEENVRLVEEYAQEFIKTGNASDF